MAVYFAIGLVIGVVIGAATVFVVFRARSRAGDRQMREAFGALAAEALDANSERLAQRAGATLEGKKALIDQAIGAVNERLEQVRQFIQRAESQRKQDLGQLSQSVGSLATTTGELHRMLASSQRRGAWGERMAEDILRLAGLVEGVNYRKQSSEDAEQGRPDFTFFLPNDLKANMDVKFPLESYKAYLDAPDDAERDEHLKALVVAVRGHVRSVAARGYIDPKVPTVPYVIVFIASEQIFSLVLSARPDLIDESIGRKVILASPLTLYAMLAVIRQSAESANLMKTADEVITLLSAVDKQLQLYDEQIDRIAKRVRQSADEFETLRTTRRNVLQRQLDKIEQLRISRELPEE